MGISDLLDDKYYKVLYDGQLLMLATGEEIKNLMFFEPAKIKLEFVEAFVVAIGGN